MIASKENKEVPALYQQYKENLEAHSDTSLDVLKFMEVHKRGIDFYNSYGLSLNKKGSKDGGK